MFGGNIGWQYARGISAAAAACKGLVVLRFQGQMISACAKFKDLRKEQRLETLKISSDVQI